MERDEVITKIRAHSEAIQALGAAGLYLYGSVAKNAASPESDVDIFIDRSPKRHFGFIELTELEFLLARILGASVDVSTRTGLHPALRETIEKTALRVL